MANASVSGDLNDLQMYDLLDQSWTDFSAAISAGLVVPAARDTHGFAAAGGKLYVMGGWGLAASGDKGVIRVLRECMKGLSRQLLRPQSLEAALVCLLLARTHLLQMNRCLHGTQSEVACYCWSYQSCDYFGTAPS